MKKALLLHGWEGTSKSNWFPWLKNELEQKGFEVFAPDLPNTNWPVLNEQMEHISKYVEKMGKGDIVIGHSLGCTLATQFIERNNLAGLDVILVAPTYPNLSSEIKEILGEYYNMLDNYYTSQLSFDGQENNYTILLLDNDSYINPKSAKNYYRNLQGKVVFEHFSGYGHFLEREGFLELPEILNYIR